MFIINRYFCIYKLALAFAVFFPLTVLVGQFNHYSDFPYWDLWNGDFDFYLDVLQRPGDISQWFKQHNEHRIFIQRLFFFIDNRFFDSNFVILYAANFIAPLVVLWLLTRIARRTVDSLDYRALLYLTITALIFSWIQHENFEWAFQAQFFLSYLMPLATFTSYSFYSVYRKECLLFLSILASIFSIGTMGNGALAIPLLMFQAFLSRDSKKAIYLISTVGFSALAVHIYFYKTPFNHVSAIDMVAKNPIESLKFFLVFISSPFYYIFNSKSILYALGLLEIFVFCILVFQVYKSKNTEHKKIQYSLLMIVLYGYVSALAIAGARGGAGILAATSSRYTSSSLIVISALIILIVGSYERRYEFKFFLKAMLVAIPLLITPYQLKALKSGDEVEFVKRVGMLALSLNINDYDYTYNVFPYTDWARNMLVRFKTEKIGIFSDNFFDTKIPDTTRIRFYSSKIDHVDTIEVINNEPNYLRVSGWQLCPNMDPPKKTIRRIFFIGNSNEFVGSAVVGYPRKDVKKYLSLIGENVGFVGYIKREKIDSNGYYIDEYCNAMGPITFKSN